MHKLLSVIKEYYQEKLPSSNIKLREFIPHWQSLEEGYITILDGEIEIGRISQKQMMRAMHSSFAVDELIKYIDGLLKAYNME